MNLVARLPLASPRRVSAALSAATSGAAAARRAAAASSSSAGGRGLFVAPLLHVAAPQPEAGSSMVAPSVRLLSTDSITVRRSCSFGFRLLRFWFADRATMLCLSRHWWLLTVNYRSTANLSPRTLLYLCWRASVSHLLLRRAKGEAGQRRNSASRRKFAMGNRLLPCARDARRRNDSFE
jgi:hypothetical protein